jgi:hypothetical protein
VSEELFLNALAVLESDTTAWNDAARHCENIAASLIGRKTAECRLMAAVYRERAQLISDVLQTIRRSNQPVNARRNLKLRFEECKDGLVRYGADTGALPCPRTASVPAFLEVTPRERPTSSREHFPSRHRRDLLNDAAHHCKDIRERFSVRTK